MPSTLRWGVEVGAVAEKRYIFLLVVVYTPRLVCIWIVRMDYPAEGGRCMELRVGVTICLVHVTVVWS
jgi:hypothetical protein